ncbi:hypothetical protein VS877_22190, partial [Salmonella enterica subsp. enterica serovar Paratyphi A]|nr:hypothetical protein [Salmonella enterica subsp. enterica serovar Paratyphi A]
LIICLVSIWMISFTRKSGCSTYIEKSFHLIIKKGVMPDFELEDDFFLATAFLDDGALKGVSSISETKKPPGKVVFEGSGNRQVSEPW